VGVAEVKEPQEARGRQAGGNGPNSSGGVEGLGSLVDQAYKTYFCRDSGVFRPLESGTSVGVCWRCCDLKLGLCGRDSDCSSYLRSSAHRKCETHFCRGSAVFWPLESGISVRVCWRCCGLEVGLVGRHSGCFSYLRSSAHHGRRGAGLGSFDHAPAERHKQSADPISAIMRLLVTMDSPSVVQMAKSLTVVPGAPAWPPYLRAPAGSPWQRSFIA
jgi:hypothetical protein